MGGSFRRAFVNTRRSVSEGRPMMGADIYYVLPLGWAQSQVLCLDDAIHSLWNFLREMFFSPLHR